MPQEKVIGSLLEEVFTADEARQFRENNRRVIETETPLIQEEWAEAPDGRRYFQTIKFPLRDPGMRTVAIGGISIGLTEHRRAEEALSESRRAERRRIARDLHDIVLQDLAGALQSLRLTDLQSKGSGLGLDLEEELEALGRATSGLRSAIYDLRHEKEQPFLKISQSVGEADSAGDARAQDTFGCRGRVPGRSLWKAERRVVARTAGGPRERSAPLRGEEYRGGVADG